MRLFVVEGVGQRRGPLGSPVETDVAYDSEEPGAAIAADKRPKIPKGSERRFLYSVFRVVLIPHQPARQPTARIEMRQHDVVKARSRVSMIPIGRNSLFMQGSDDLLKSLLEGGILELEPGSAQSYVREDLRRRACSRPEPGRPSAG